MKNIILSSAILLSTLLSISSCKPKHKSHNTDNQEVIDSTVIVIEAESFISSSEKFAINTSKSDTKYIQATSEGWIALEVPVHIAGRYQTQLLLKSNTNKTITCWIEDYYDNTDERTYNITGNIAVLEPSKDFIVKSVDGSPLNKGVHKMKVHFSEAVDLDQIKFSLIKNHDITPVTLTQNTEGNEWKVVWADEFEGTEIDTTKWTYDIGNWGWGNNELQYYTKNKTENARIENGNLIIEALKDDEGNGWTSARLTTRGKTSFLYGKIEFRAKVPAHKGNWAAGWTLGDDYVDELSWPYCGEIDILESVGYEMDNDTGNGVAHASAHCRAYYFKLGNQPTSIINIENMKMEYHTYAIEWTSKEIKAFVDDRHYFTYTDDRTEHAWPFSKSQNIILNLAMGGGWGGLMGMDETITSQKMIIDYVRVFERN